MNSIFVSFVLISIQWTKQLNGFEDNNVWEAFQTNEKSVENDPKFTESSQELYETGRQRFQLMAKQEIIYGNCWRNAIQSLETNCKQLNEDIQSRLALSFANCFLLNSGLETYPCDERQDIKLCIKGMTDRAFNSYTEFFTHTQSVCFYLQSEYWQQRTESTIDRLTETSIKVKDRLEDANQQLDRLNGLQELSIGSQNKLNEDITSARNTINEFKTSSAEQRFIVREILDRFIRLQDFVLIEMSYGYSLLFFFVSLIVVYFLTTPVRTNEARLWLFVVLVINLFAERLIASYSVDDQFIGLKTTAIIINERIWLSRKITLLLMTAMFLWFAITYKDYGFVNYSILNEHTLRLNTIQNQLNQMFKTGIPPKEQSNELMKCRDREYSSSDDSDFACDSDYSTNGSDISEDSFDTCSTVSTVAIVSSSTTKSTDNPLNSEKVETNIENLINDLEPIRRESPRTYDLRPRKSNITYTKSGIIEEPIQEFMAKVKLSETISKINHQNVRKFLSSDED